MPGSEMTDDELREWAERQPEVVPHRTVYGIGLVAEAVCGLLEERDRLRAKLAAIRDMTDDDEIRGFVDEVLEAQP